MALFFLESLAGEEGLKLLHCSSLWRVFHVEMAPVGWSLQPRGDKKREM